MTYRPLPRLSVAACLVTLSIAAAGLPVAAWSAPLTSADTNGDGQISRDEAMAAQNASFKRLDDDDDGQLTRDEFNAGQPGLPHGATDADRKQRRAIIGRWFDRIDANGDDTITPAEYRRAVSPYFDRLDANHDGKISADELRQSFEQADEAQEELERNSD